MSEITSGIFIFLWVNRYIPFVVIITAVSYGGSHSIPTVKKAVPQQQQPERLEEYIHLTVDYILFFVYTLKSLRKTRH